MYGIKIDMLLADVEGMTVTQYGFEVYNNLNILHLVQDEKFPDSAYEFFEAVAPGQNTYVLAGKSASIKHLTKITPLRVNLFAFLSKRFIRFISSYDAVILHSLYPFALEVLARIHPKVSVVWIGMGYDYYDLINDELDYLLKPETLRLYKLGRVQKRRILLSSLKRVARRILYSNSNNKRQLIKRIDLFAPVLESEHTMIKAAVGEPFPGYIRWNYGKIADLIDGKLGSREVCGGNILVGNSATHTNNHIDIFLHLAKVGVPKQSKVVVPLSYGDPEYREKVLEEGERLFGSQFAPICEFISFEDYINLLSTCSNVVMNHRRQQAAGNLFISLYLGAKVYLDPQNPLYEEFSSIGLAINAISTITSDSLSKRLPSTIVARNQKILEETRGRAAFERYTENLIAELMRLRLRKAR